MTGVQTCALRSLLVVTNVLAALARFRCALEGHGHVLQWVGVRVGVGFRVVVDGFCAEWGEKKRQARLDANWQTIADVDWEDLEHFVELARVTKASAHFDTCVRIIEALRKQVKAK